MYTIPLSLSSLFPICGLPLRLDSYKGCVYDCSYCFARARERSTNDSKVQPADPDYLKRLFKRVFDDSKPNTTIISQFLERRVPLHFGGMSDPFQPAEAKFKITLNYFLALKNYEYPFAISTRGDLIATEPYLSILRDMKAVVVQFSMSSMDDRVALIAEDERVSPSRILKAMEILRSNGIRVTCRWQPYIPGVSTTPEDYISTVASAGCQHISFEYLKILIGRRSNVVDAVQEISNKNIYKDYINAGASHLGTELILPAAKRIETVLHVKKLAIDSKMTFGAADNDLQYLSSTETCCSGVDNFPGFENWFKHQIANAVRRSKDKKYITISSILDEWSPTGSIDRYLNSMSRLSSRLGNEGSLKDHVIYRWNSSGKEGCPDFYYGVSATGKYDKDNAMIYQWDNVDEGLDQ
ncbi:radical SAM protein [Spirosoma pulveris]